MLGPVVVQGAQLHCAAGTTPATLTVTSQFIAMVNYMPVATIMDMIPMVNIPSFGKCLLMAIATMGATAVLPIPCIPSPTGPWIPGALVPKINGLPVLNMPATCACAFGGIITVIQPGQFIAQAL